MNVSKNGVCKKVAWIAATVRYMNNLRCLLTNEVDWIEQKKRWP
jgi:hypothetical protein